MRRGSGEEDGECWEVDGERWGVDGERWGVNDGERWGVDGALAERERREGCLSLAAGVRGPGVEWRSGAPGVRLRSDDCPLSGPGPKLVALVDAAGLACDGDLRTSQC